MQNDNTSAVPAAPLRKPLVMTYRSDGDLNFPSYPQPEKGRKILQVSNDTHRLYFDCELDLMALTGTFIPFGGEFSFDAEMKLDAFLQLTLMPQTAQLSSRRGVYFTRSGTTLWDRNGWQVQGGDPARLQFWANDLGTHIPDTSAIKLVRVEVKVGDEWKIARKVQVDPQAKFEFRV